MECGNLSNTLTLQLERCWKNWRATLAEQEELFGWAVMCFPWPKPSWQLCLWLGVCTHQRSVHPRVENQSWAVQISFQVVAYAGNRVKKSLLTNLLIKPWILGNEGGLETQLIFHFYKLRARANPWSNFYFCFSVLQCLLWKDSWDHLSESLALATPILVLF